MTRQHMGMVSYNPVLHTSAERELNGLDSEDRERLTDVLKDVAATQQPTQHEKARQLEGQGELFRVRVGETRAICHLDKPNLKVLKVGYRATVYDTIDEIDDRRMVA